MNHSLAVFLLSLSKMPTNHASTAQLSNSINRHLLFLQTNNYDSTHKRHVTEKKKNTTGSSCWGGESLSTSHTLLGPTHVCRILEDCYYNTYSNNDLSVSILVLFYCQQFCSTSRNADSTCYFWAQYELAFLLFFFALDWKDESTHAVSCKGNLWGLSGSGPRFCYYSFWGYSVVFF
jgi:hypothetical protein